MIDFFALRRRGTHAVYIGDDGAIRITSVAEQRGEHPWSRRPRRLRTKRRNMSQVRLRKFAAPTPLVSPDRDQWRPEIEGADPFDWSQ